MFGSVPAAIVRRLARWVRSGPIRLPAGVPAMAWHMTQDEARKTSCPRRAAGSVGVAAGVALAGQPAGEQSGGSATTTKRHLRVLVPAELGALAAIDAGAVGLEPEAVFVAGDQVASCRSGWAAQKLWITSLERSSKTTGPAYRDVDLVGGGDPVLRQRSPGTGSPTTTGARSPGPGWRRYQDWS